MNSKPATSVKKKPPLRMFTCEYIRTFGSSRERSCMSSVFFDKIQGCVLQRWSFIKTLVHYRLFSQKRLSLFFFKQLVFGTFPKNNLWWILFIAKLQPENCRLITLLKETSSQKFPKEFSKLLQSIIFRNISLCGGEENYMKDYLKARR